MTKLSRVSYLLSHYVVWGLGVAAVVSPCSFTCARSQCCAIQFAFIRIPISNHQIKCSTEQVKPNHQTRACTVTADVCGLACCLCVHTSRLTEFSLLLRGLAFLGVLPPDEWLDELFLRSEAALRIRSIPAAQAANMAWSLAMLKVRTYTSITAVIQHGYESFTKQ